MLNHDTCNTVLLLNEHGNSEVAGLLNDMTIHRQWTVKRTQFKQGK